MTKQIPDIVLSFARRCAKRTALLNVAILMVTVVAFVSCGEEPKPEAQTIHVLEYCPAMGQFVNVLPQYQEGFTAEDMCREAERYLNAGSVITLGGFGGYVTMSLDSPVKNRQGYDFRITGNAFRQQGSDEYGNSEPGAVWVSRDENGNGKPDDAWYELAGSDHFLETTIHHYTKVWHKSDTTMRNPFHTQPYFPQWLQDTVITATGTRLASVAKTTGGVVSQRIRDYGYADNKPNNDIEGTSFDLDWAVDAEGRQVKLESCDFVRVVTAVDEVFAQIGELSTEVAGLVVD